MEKNWLDKFSLIVEENKRKFQYGLFAFSLSGLLYALKSVHPFKKFQHAKDIPKSFVERKVKLNGSVLNIEVNSNVIVRVDHNPIFWSHFRRKSIPGLAIDISSINISETGISWLQYTLQGQTRKNVAHELVSLGLATVDKINFALENDKFYLKYYQSLLKLEEKAEKKHIGVWSSTEYSTIVKIKNILRYIFYKLKW
ncbi:hypothetical protein PGB90_005097 [Kerria lacca]